MIVGVILSTYFIGKKLTSYENVHMELKDKRIKILSEVVNAIKYVKMNGWEKIFANRIKSARSEELKLSWKKYHLDAVSAANFLIGPQGVLMGTLGVYLLLGNEFDVKKIITIYSTFWILAGPFHKIPEFVNAAIECRVSVKRIENFLVSEEIDTSYIRQEDNVANDLAIQISKGNFCWSSKNCEEDANEVSINTKKEGFLQDSSSKNIELSTSIISTSKFDEESDSLRIESDSLRADLNDETDTIKEGKLFELKDLSMTVKKGQLVAIIGEIGSGKSSLLCSLVGEMDHKNAEVYINGRMAFLPQKAWIINASLKNNILFGKTYNAELYKKCIYYSALEDDIKVLPNGDETEIGERGINLSGG